ncbi:MAG: sulfurtransferase-like selenium metabolism protein YedF [Bacillota bacterium]
MTRKVDTEDRGTRAPVMKITETGDGAIQLTVGDRQTAGSICHAAGSLSLESAVTERDDDTFQITITSEECQRGESHEDSDLVILLQSDVLGADAGLGRILVRSFIHTIADDDYLPRVMIFLNRGVYLTCAGSAVLEDLLVLQSRGVQILSCGTCLDYFDLKDELSVGSVTNMYTIEETLTRAGRVLSL